MCQTFGRGMRLQDLQFTLTILVFGPTLWNGVVFDMNLWYMLTVVLFIEKFDSYMYNTQ